MSPPVRRLAVSMFPLLTVFSACSEQPLAPSESAVLAKVAPKASVAPTLWSPAGPGTVTLISDGSAANPSMSYALHGSAVWSTQTWSFSTTAATSGAITETWDYNGFHAWFMVRAFIKPFIIHNAVKTYLPGAAYGPASCCSGPPSGGFLYTGNTTFNVSAGDTYGFEFGGSNGDSDTRLLGTFTIKYPVPPADATPPSILAAIAGTLGNNSWYTSNVGVSWTVTDAESAITSSAGCGPSTLGSDSNGETYTCSATSAGGSASESITVKRDATAPDIAFSGNAGTYTVDQAVNISCAATDATSGLASSNCPGASGAAYSFGVGTQTLAASAEDNAGNTATASTQFTVQVTSGSLCALVNQWVSQKGVANSMCVKLRQGSYGAFRNEVSAQSGKKFLSAAHAAILIALSQNL